VFLDADDGYCKPRWWEGRPRQDEPGELFWSFGNYPAINVSWYDALAYCRWLGAKLGVDLRLPTEWEWQWAAAGATQQEYPWSGDWNPARANSREGGILRTAAAGLYPRGRSPFGLEDMAGNVWEWCLNAHREPSSASLEGDVARVVRGGSWYYYADSARAAARSYHSDPDFRSVDIGFRVLCSAHIE
jgi:formylglycine-generating enzyme required for sulfatase activity